VKPPIVIAESYDISVHPSVEHAEAQLEPVDVNDGIYVGYDCEGHLLDLKVEFVSRKHHFLCFKWTLYHEAVIISEHEPVSDCSNELRSKLVHCLASKKIPEKELQEASLDWLIRQVGRYMPWRLFPKDS
jgi:hypothetical protein